MGESTALGTIGLKGLKAVYARPEIKGTAHAWIGVLAGGVFGFGYLVVLAWILLAI